MKVKTQSLIFNAVGMFWKEGLENYTWFTLRKKIFQPFCEVKP